MSIQPVTASASRKATKSGAPDPHKQTASKSDIVLRALKRKFGVSTDELTKLTGCKPKVSEASCPARSARSLATR